MDVQISAPTFLVLLLFAAGLGYAAAARQATRQLEGLWEENRRLMHCSTIEDGLADMAALAEVEWEEASTLEEYFETYMAEHCMAELGPEFIEDDGGQWLCRLPRGHLGAHLP